MRRLRAAALVLLASGPVHAAEWRNSDGGQFTFRTTFEGEALKGLFREFTLSFDFSPASPEGAHLVVTVALHAADLGDPDMNAVLFDKAWFDIEHFGTAVFESRFVEGSPGQKGPGQEGPGQVFLAQGVLKLKGIEKPVTVPFTWLRDGDRARMRGTFSLNRTDFGIGTGEWATGDAVGLSVRLDFDIPLALAE